MSAPPAKIDRAPSTTAPEIDGYVLELVPGENRRRLIVATSGANSLGLRKRYPCDTLYLADLATGYFITSPARLAAALTGFVDAGGYERLLFVGSSKAGYAVLMLAGLCARARPRLPVRVLSLNPVTQLFPDDPIIPYPSYRKMQRRAKVTDTLARRLRRFGDLTHLAWLPNFHAVITYPARDPIDCAQALRMSGPNFRRHPVDSMLHNTTIFFTWSGVAEATVLRRLERMFDDAGDDLDLEATRPDDLAAVARAISESDLPSFEDLVEDAMTVDPPSPPALGRLNRAVMLRVTLVRRALRGGRHLLARRFAGHGGVLRNPGYEADKASPRRAREPRETSAAAQSAPPSGAAP